MKKNKNYDVENNQENGDVYTLYPDNALIYENEKKRKGKINHKNTINSDSTSTKKQFRRLIRSNTLVFSRIIEVQVSPSPLLTKQVSNGK